MNAQDTLAVAKTLVECLKRRDSEGLISLLHDDILLEVPFPLVKGENTTGARRQHGKAVHAYAHDLKARTSRITFENVVWRTTSDGMAVFQADGDITLSDGRHYPNHYLMMFEVKDGKIVHWVEYLNPVNAIRAFGAPLDTLP